MYFLNTRHIIFGLCLLAAVPFSSIAVAAGGFTFNQIADTSTPRPDGAGLFVINHSVVTPAIDGSKVVFITQSFPVVDSIWSANTDGSGLLKLVDLGSSVPGGVGNFSHLDFVGAPLVKGGSVVFSGTDSSQRAYLDRGGLYTVPVLGGTISRVANYNTPVPGGTGNFTKFGDNSRGRGSFSIDGGKVAFEGWDQISDDGIFVANLDGSNAVAVVGSFGGFRCPNDFGNFFFPLGNFTNPSISGNSVSYWGNGVFDPSTGSNKVFVAPAVSGFNCNFVGSSLTPLPDDPDGTLHTRYAAGHIQIDGGIVVFAADDSQPFDPTFNNFRGLFAVCADGSSSVNNLDGTPATPTCGLPKRTIASASPFTPIVDILSSLPGISGGINSNSFVFSFNQGQVLFRAFEETPDQNEGLYLAKLSDGSITRVISVGDTLDGAQVRQIANPGAGALSGGNLVFSALLSDGTIGVYSATQPTLPACALDVSANVKVTRSGFRLNRSTGRYVQTLTLTNTGGSSINGPITLILSNLSANASLVNKSGNTSCLAPAGVPYITVGLTGNVLGAGSSVAVALNFTNSSSQPILYTTQIGADKMP